MKKYDELASDAVIAKTISALEKGGMGAVVVADAAAAKKKVLELIPKGAEVMDTSSVTLESIDLLNDIRDPGKYDAVKPKLMALNRETHGRQMQKMGAAPDYIVGSVHAITEGGQVLIASNTGSQLPSYTYGSAHVIWVVGTQKIVKNLDDAYKRLNEYIVPLEAEHMKQKYGRYGTNVSKVLIVNKEVRPGRITVIFVREKLGF